MKSAGFWVSFFKCGELLLLLRRRWSFNCFWLLGGGRGSKYNTKTLNEQDRISDRMTFDLNIVSFGLQCIIAAVRIYIHTIRYNICSRYIDYVHISNKYLHYYIIMQNARLRGQVPTRYIFFFNFFIFIPIRRTYYNIARGFRIFDRGREYTYFIFFHHLISESRYTRTQRSLAI